MLLQQRDTDRDLPTSEIVSFPEEETPGDRTVNCYARSNTEWVKSGKL